MFPYFIKYVLTNKNVVNIITDYQLEIITDNWTSVQLQGNLRLIGRNVEVPCLQAGNQTNQKQIVTKNKL